MAELPPADDRRDQPVGRGPGEAGVGLVGPLHRGADGEALGAEQVVTHAISSP
jgi:hypothetical protein